MNADEPGQAAWTVFDAIGLWAVPAGTRGKDEA